MAHINYEGIKETTERQENLLVFPHFSNRDAYELGKFLTEKVYDEGLELALAIRRLNGELVYQHLTEGTGLNNENWMMRKFRTVSLMKRSSLGAWAVSNLTGETVASHGLCDRDYVFCGGGFPIRLESGEMVGILTVSNLPHLEDHGFIIRALSEWLEVEGVPAVISE